MQPNGNPIPLKIQRSIEMTTVKATLLSIAMLFAIMLSAVGIYGADMASDHNVVDGYGVNARLR
jgi:hypothetical protein